MDEGKGDQHCRIFPSYCFQQLQCYTIHVVGQKRKTTKISAYLTKILKVLIKGRNTLVDKSQSKNQPIQSTFLLSALTYKGSKSKNICIEQSISGLDRGLKKYIIGLLAHIVNLIYSPAAVWVLIFLFFSSGLNI